MIITGNPLQLKRLRRGKFTLRSEIREWLPSDLERSNIPAIRLTLEIESLEADLRDKKEVGCKLQAAADKAQVSADECARQIQEMTGDLEALKKQARAA